MMKILTETVIDGKPFDDVIRSDTVSLWTAVPKGVLMKYVSSPNLRREIAALWKKKPTRTLFSSNEKSLKRRLLVMRCYFGYFKSFKRYYFSKETLR